MFESIGPEGDIGMKKPTIQRIFKLGRKEWLKLYVNTLTEYNT